VRGACRTRDRSDVSMTDQQQTDSRRRSQAVAGAIAGFGVIVVLVLVFIVVQVTGKDTTKTTAAPAPVAATAAPAPTAAPTEAPSDAAAAPQPSTPSDVKTPAALAKKPVVKAGGTTRLTKLKVTTLVKGTGPKVATGQTILTNYVLATYADGKTVQATWDQGQPVPLTVGQLIPGFDQGIVGVPVGSRVQLDIPAALAYGDQPQQQGAPAGDLRFVVDVLAAQ
jgi:peptidylprolyl isomerase